MNSLSYSTIQLSDVTDVSVSSITLIQTKTCLRGLHISVCFGNISQSSANIYRRDKFNVEESFLVKCPKTSNKELIYLTSERGIGMWGWFL